MQLAIIHAHQVAVEVHALLLVHLPGHGCEVVPPCTLQARGRLAPVSQHRNLTKSTGICACPFVETEKITNAADDSSCDPPQDSDFTP